MTKEIEKVQGEQFLVAEEAAIPEIKAFIEYHQDIVISDDRASDQYLDIPKDFRNILKAVKRGLLDLSDLDAPVLTLKKPLLSEGGNFNTEKIVFKTRITKSTLAQLTKGFDIGKNPIGFANILSTYYTGIGSVALLDKISECKTDIQTIDEVVGLFQ